jgi:sugar phosphate isomerase/epimerase
MALSKSLKISIATILWGKSSNSSRFARILEDIKGIGFDGVGFETRFLPSMLFKSPTELRELVESTGLENAGSYSSMKPVDIDWAAKSGTPLLWVVVRREKKIQDAIRALSKFTKLARESSIVPALHNHLGTCFETAEEIDKALVQVDGLKLCFDTAHAEAAGIEQEEFIRKYHESIALVHLKDLRRKVPKSKVSFTKDFVNVGKGIVDFGDVISNLVQYRYDGSLMLELDAARGSKPNVLAEEGYTRISKILSSTK